MSNSSITKRAIKDGFRELLEEQPLEKITVRDIAVRCGINRNTFYYHYQDIQSLLEEMSAEDVERIVMHYPELNSLEECVEEVMSYALTNRKIVNHVIKSAGRGIYTSSLWKVSEHVVTCYLENIFPGLTISEYDKKLVIKYFTCSCFGLVIDWVNAGMPDDSKNDLHRILSSCKGIAELVLKNMGADPIHGSPPTSGL